MAGNMQPPPPPPGGSPPPSGGGGGAAKASPTPAEIVIMVAGAVVLLGSILPFYEASGQGQSLDWNAWTNGWSLFPITTLLVIYAVVAAVQVALARFGSTQLPSRVLSFTWPQLHLAFGVLATLTMLAYLLRDTGGIIDKGIGFWLMMLGAIGILVGGVMEQQQSPSSSGRFGDAR